MCITGLMSTFDANFDHSVDQCFVSDRLRSFSDRFLIVFKQFFSSQREFNFQLSRAEARAGPPTHRADPSRLALAWPIEICFLLLKIWNENGRKKETKTNGKAKENKKTKERKNKIKREKTKVSKFSNSEILRFQTSQISPNPTKYINGLYYYTYIRNLGLSPPWVVYPLPPGGGG